MPGARVKLQATKIKCIETETFTGADKLYLLTSGSIKPKNTNAQAYSKRVPPGGYWSLNNGDEISPDAILLALDDFEGSGNLLVEAFDQDMDQSIPDEVIDRAVESVQQSVVNVARSAAVLGDSAVLWALLQFTVHGALWHHLRVVQDRGEARPE